MVPKSSTELLATKPINHNIGFNTDSIIVFKISKIITVLTLFTTTVEIYLTGVFCFDIDSKYKEEIVLWNTS